MSRLEALVTQTPASSMTLNRFVELFYLPYAKEQERPSTERGYRDMWNRYIKPRGEIALRDFRTIDGEQLLLDVARNEDLNRSDRRQLLFPVNDNYISRSTTTTRVS